MKNSAGVVLVLTNPDLAGTWGVVTPLFTRSEVNLFFKSLLLINRVQIPLWTHTVDSHCQGGAYLGPNRALSATIAARKGATSPPTGTHHVVAPSCLLSAWKTFLLPESQGSLSHATAGFFLAVRFHAGRGAVLSHLLWDLQGPRGSEVQPQFLPGLSATVLEQEGGQARVSHLQEEVLPDGAHGEPGTEECGRHLLEGAGAKDGQRYSMGRGASRGGGGDVHHTRGSSEALLSGWLGGPLLRVPHL